MVVDCTDQFMDIKIHKQGHNKKFTGWKFARRWTHEPTAHLHIEEDDKRGKKESKESNPVLELSSLFDSRGCKVSESTVKQHFHYNKLFGSTARKKPFL